jgi:hypothetical protein
VETFADFILDVVKLCIGLAAAAFVWGFVRGLRGTRDRQRVVCSHCLVRRDEARTEPGDAVCWGCLRVFQEAAREIKFTSWGSVRAEGDRLVMERTRDGVVN